MSDDQAARLERWRKTFWTAHVPGIGGVIKKTPEDFVVEEVPLYEPHGVGEHLYVWLEKRDASAVWAQRVIARHFGVDKSEVGSAGNKDRHAVTRQWMSVPVPRGSLVDDRFERFLGVVDQAQGAIKILRIERHGHKLRRGHLKGNRFELTLRDLNVELTLAQVRERTDQILGFLREHGVLNLYGPQRFGHGGSTLSLGLGLIHQDAAAMRQVRRDKFLKRLSLNSVQSALFNEALVQRLEQGDMERVYAGDVMGKMDTSGVFVVKEGEVDEAQERLDRQEIVVTGPMFGPRMKAASLERGLKEAALLESFGLNLSAWTPFRKLMPGARRPFVIRASDLEWDVDEDEAGALLVHLRFFLPSGAYATVVLGELSKSFD